jgi:hypothetical protein
MILKLWRWPVLIEYYNFAFGPKALAIIVAEKKLITDPPTHPHLLNRPRDWRSANASNDNRNTIEKHVKAPDMRFYDVYFTISHSKRKRKIFSYTLGLEPETYMLYETRV